MCVGEPENVYPCVSQSKSVATLRTGKIKRTDAPDGNINNKMKRGILWVSVIMNTNHHIDMAPRNLAVKQIFCGD